MPDRARGLRPEVFAIFERAGVAAILHAGDISRRSVLDELQEIAPVYAVRGNRDWGDLKSLPAELSLEFEGVRIGLMHGHGSLEVYLMDKVSSVFLGTQPERYLKRALSAFPGARVVIYGHTHIPVKRWVDGRLYLNPGSAAFPAKKVLATSVAILRIDPGKGIDAQIIYF